jgi:hypothetical protein
LFHVLTNSDSRLSNGLSTNFRKHALLHNSLYSFGSEISHPDPDLPPHFRKEVVKINGQIRYHLSDLNAINPGETFFGQTYTLRPENINSALLTQEHITHRDIPQELIADLANVANSQEVRRVIAQTARRHQITSTVDYYKLLDVI